jgi:hypothetical protein
MIERLREALAIYGDRYTDVDFTDDEPGIEFRLAGKNITIFIEEACGQLSFWTCDNISEELQAAMDRISKKKPEPAAYNLDKNIRQTVHMSKGPS